MVLINSTTMQAMAKVVYYGPGLCGKTTNLHQIHARTAPDARGEMVSLETETDRTLFFDLLPLEVGTIGGMKVRLQLYTVPGQVFYNATRRLVLKNVDGIVFVADSQEGALQANLESFDNLRANLADLGLRLEDIPLVFQYNKRDLRQIVPIETLERELNRPGVPHFEAAAREGLGVFETLKGISRLALTAVRQKVAPQAPERARGQLLLEVAPPKASGKEDTKPLPALKEGSLSERKKHARLTVPGELLGSARRIGVHLSFQGDKGVSLKDAVAVPLEPSERTKRLRLRLDIEIDAED